MWAFKVRKGLMKLAFKLHYETCFLSLTWSKSQDIPASDALIFLTYKSLKKRLCDHVSIK